MEKKPQVIDVTPKQIDLGNGFYLILPIIPNSNYKLIVEKLKGKGLKIKYAEVKDEQKEK